MLNSGLGRLKDETTVEVSCCFHLATWLVEVYRRVPNGRYTSVGSCTGSKTLCEALRLGGLGRSADLCPSRLLRKLKSARRESIENR